MAETTRQQNLLVAEDWKKIYQSFRNADFQAYDYENLRKAMIDYLRLYYPEDFNDFIESDEYIALIDLIAYLGQSLAFRNDLNTRENFIDTAERRDSILRLAKLISYKGQRNKPAAGLLKFESISTSESLIDSEGIDLNNFTVFWNDNTNDNWLEQFVTILNAALVSGQRVGKSGNSQTINGTKTDEYRLNTFAGNLFKFEAEIQGAPINFEVVGATTEGKSSIYEVAPGDNTSFSILNRNDFLGNASNDTGWFLYFKQGTLQSLDLNLLESLSNRVVSVSVDNINNIDTWFYKIDSNGLLEDLWTEVPSVGFTNIAYNKLNATNRKIYEISTRLNDQVDLVFGDGVFAEIPQGRFRYYYRTSNNSTYKIVPNEISNVTISVPYISRNNRQETLTIVASLKYTVSNASSRESLADIKQNAPQQYYTQNRMVNGEDYNILPFTLFENVVKSKAVNRSSSGISRFLDVLDVTGKYSSTNIFCDDGILYDEETLNSFSFEFATKSDIQHFIETQLLPLFNLESIKHFYYDKYDRTTVTGVYWHRETNQSNGSTGYYKNIGDVALTIGNYVAPSSNRYYLRVGALVKYWAGAGNYFNLNRQITAGSPMEDGESEYLWATIRSVDVDGAYDQDELDFKQQGPVIINEIIPTGAEIVQIIPTFNNSLSSTLRITIVNKINEYKDFAIGYDQESFSYYVISAEDLDTTSDFSLTYAQDTSQTNKDSSWLVRFETDGSTYVVYFRGLEYIFESVLETRFYFDKTLRVYDVKTGTVIQDSIKVLKYNTKPDTTESMVVSKVLQIYDSIIESDGYRNNKRIKVTFNDLDDDGIPGNPDFFLEIIAPDVNPETKKVFYKIVDGEEIPQDRGVVVQDYNSLEDIELNKNNFENGIVFYVTSTDVFYLLTVVSSTRTITVADDYIYKVGRQDLAFQYRHNSPNNRRIDPSPNNIIDLYILTTTYNDDYRRWLADITDKVIQPSELTSEDLRLEFDALEDYKMVSDTIVYNNAKFKPLFGDKADSALRATFKVVKNPSSAISDTEIKVRLINAMNTYFAIENWDFGEAFFYTELSSYLHKELATFVSSIVLVPQDSALTFGSLFQINLEPDEIFVSAATVNNVEVIPAITSENINQG